MLTIDENALANYIIIKMRVANLRAAEGENISNLSGIVREDIRLLKNTIPDLNINCLWGDNEYTGLEINGTVYHV